MYAWAKPRGLDSDEVESRLLSNDGLPVFRAEESPPMLPTVSELPSSLHNSAARLASVGALGTVTDGDSFARSDGTASAGDPEMVPLGLASSLEAWERLQVGGAC